MNNTVLYFLIGIFACGALLLGYLAKGSGALIAISIVLGVLVLLLAFFGGHLGGTPV